MSHLDISSTERAGLFELQAASLDSHSATSLVNQYFTDSLTRCLMVYPAGSIEDPSRSTPELDIQFQRITEKREQILAALDGRFPGISRGDSVIDPQELDDFFLAIRCIQAYNGEPADLARFEITDFTPPNGTWGTLKDLADFYVQSRQNGAEHLKGSRAFEGLRSRFIEGRRSASEEHKVSARNERRPVFILPRVTSTIIEEGRRILSESIHAGESCSMEISTVRNTATFEPEQQIVSNHTVQYPDSVVQALASLCDEYQHAFGDLVEANREWDTDYAYIMRNGIPNNIGVQIDMVSLPQSFLNWASGQDSEVIKEILRPCIFEIENSLAMYGLLNGLFRPEGGSSYFEERFRGALDVVRRQHNMPIALLAVTEAKYEGMLGAEFGRTLAEGVTPEEVRRISGFDHFFSPTQFVEYLSSTQGKCGYLLYVRSSEPVEKLRDPRTAVEHPLLGNSEMRRLIRHHSLTFNIDAPGCLPAARINDTKMYAPRLGMGFVAEELGDIFSAGILAHMKGAGSFHSYGGARFTSAFAEFLQSQGVSLKDAEVLRFRGKPALASYGCYGHVSGQLSDNFTRKELTRNMTARGAFIIQVERETPTVRDESSGAAYVGIDRVFFALGRKTNGQASHTFLCGFNSLMPMDTVEAKKGRNHGNDQTVWREIRNETPL